MLACPGSPRRGHITVCHPATRFPAGAPVRTFYCRPRVSLCMRGWPVSARVNRAPRAGPCVQATYGAGRRGRTGIGGDAGLRRRGRQGLLAAPQALRCLLVHARQRAQQASLRRRAAVRAGCRGGVLHRVKQGETLRVPLVSTLTLTLLRGPDDSATGSRPSYNPCACAATLCKGFFLDTPISKLQAETRPWLACGQPYQCCQRRSTSWAITAWPALPG